MDHCLVRRKMLNIHCVIDVFNKCAKVKPLKDKIGKTALMLFFKTVNKSNCKPNELCID